MASRTFIIQPGEGIAFRFCGQFLGFSLLGVNIQYNPDSFDWISVPVKLRGGTYPAPDIMTG